MQNLWQLIRLNKEVLFGDARFQECVSCNADVIAQKYALQFGRAVMGTSVSETELAAAYSTGLSPNRETIFEEFVPILSLSKLLAKLMRNVVAKHTGPTAWLDNEICSGYLVNRNFVQLQDYHPCKIMEKDIKAMLTRTETEVAHSMDKYGILAWLNAVMSLAWYGITPFAFAYNISSANFTETLTVPVLESQMIWLALLEPADNPKIKDAVQTTIYACPNTKNILEMYSAPSSKERII